MAGAPGWDSWTFDPLLSIALIAAAAWYVSMLRRVHRVTGRRVGPGHWLAYGSGLGVLAIALISPLDAIGDKWLLSAHMLQHVLLADVAPALLILGLRAPVLPLGLPHGMLRSVAPQSRLGRFWRVATNPWVALPAWAAATWIWAIPAIFDYTAQHPLLHAFEHATLFYTGFALWWLIITPLPSDRRDPGMVRLTYLGFSRGASALVCLPLAWLGHTIYPLYANAPRAYGISASTDQHIAGGLMCLIEVLVFGIALVAVFIDMLGRDERAQELGEAAAASR
ncbi:MAG TPA: cytochrome c oxidase assembly protein [Solirubrobacteraceae bacterium]|nr:cytochrome c oxidase assembly protein [Solirubrobacteraceae bacterium]